MNPTGPHTGSGSLADELRAVHATGRSRPLDWRLGQLAALERLLAEHGKTFARTLEDDLGKCRAEAWLTEIDYVAGAARHARRHLRRWARVRRVATPLSLRPGSSRVLAEPLGAVLVLSPWNYPLQLCLAPLVTALSAGNCVAIKPSELAPATAGAMAQLLPRYLDPDHFRVIEGGVETSTWLLEQHWDHIIFTGSERVARIVMQAAARYLTPVTLELGGKSPCVVLPDADLGIAARRIAWAKFLNAGQSCIAPDYVLTDAATAARLAPLLREAIESMYGDDPARSADYGRIIDARHFDRLQALLAGEHVFTGGQGARETLYLAPTVLTSVQADSAIMQEEIFGPVLPIVECAGLDAALAFIRSRPKPLAAYLFTTDDDAHRRMAEVISAGSLGINDLMLFMAVKELPFGGVGPSGTGNYKGEEGFLRLSHQKAVLKRGLRPEIRLRYPPFSRRKLGWLRKLL
ncbi:MAG: aldehyde dehydrogenase family protein [Xanthomonadales bacterium]|nr:aldehyde dehydrogenase family protein [Xanthomonadales bacterium]NIN59861.1 aldehyde dehydrogenase family protein [Xanthomonadales bacterium]NIN75235.1 aldehyde dehydrogenase family protein [Xanthomonadales bacterium]NIO13477.1 aldehyde dehydrogenase family protein [Xanthomonadales bacterium]NIP12254.1 aldehyde dehydrogenase family protein [Xanthomonadales bacterium]